MVNKSLLLVKKFPFKVEKLRSTIILLVQIVEKLGFTAKLFGVATNLLAHEEAKSGFEVNKSSHQVKLLLSMVEKFSLIVFVFQRFLPLLLRLITLLIGRQAIAA
jgi:hypothetical protein